MLVMATSLVSSGRTARQSCEWSAPTSPLNEPGYVGGEMDLPVC